MMLCRETPPNAFLLCFAGASVVCSVCAVGEPAHATLETVSAPMTPTRAPIRYLRLRIPLLFRWAISLTAPQFARAASPWICHLSVNLTQGNGRSCAHFARESDYPK